MIRCIWRHAALRPIQQRVTPPCTARPSFRRRLETRAQTRTPTVPIGDDNGEIDLSRARKLLQIVGKDLQHAQNEVRWMREFAASKEDSKEVETAMDRMMRDRQAGKPLQYILGTQPFGDLEILCRSGVLIPRPETESITTYLATLLSSHEKLRILDLCTGSGCMTLLLLKLLFNSERKGFSIAGVDASPAAVSLARRNLQHNTGTKHTLEEAASKRVNFYLDDIMSHPSSLVTFQGPSGMQQNTEWLLKPQPTPPRLQKSFRQYDILVANPPYISGSSFLRDVSSSVRAWEPRTALVPPLPDIPLTDFAPGSLTSSHGSRRQMRDTDKEHGDFFYPRLIEIAESVKAKVVMFEVGGQKQAARIVGMFEAARKSQQQVKEKEVRMKKQTREFPDSKESETEGTGTTLSPSDTDWVGCQIWRDSPAQGEKGRKFNWKSKSSIPVLFDGEPVDDVGEGNGRAVFAWTRAGASMLGEKFAK